MRQTQARFRNVAYSWQRLAWVAVRCGRMVDQVCCGVVGCGRATRYRFPFTAGAEESRCGLHGLVYWPVCRRAIAVALVVGTILMLINQADVLLTGHSSAFVVAKIGLTYLVPFSVSAYSALAANRLK